MLSLSERYTHHISKERAIMVRSLSKRLTASKRFAAILLLPTSFLCFGRAPGAQSSSFAGPAFGFLATGDTELRPILGMPGASHLGDAIPLPASVTKLHIAPGAAYALAEQPSGTGILKLRIPASKADTLAVAPLADAATLDSFAFSPSGQIAALYSKATDSIQIITGLPDAPSASAKLSTAAIPDAVNHLAVSDDGAVVLAADASGIYSLQAGSAPAIVMASTAASALAFLPNSHDALTCDRSQNTVTLLSSVTTNPEVNALSKTITDPAAISSSADGKIIFVSSPSQPRVWTIDRFSGLTKFYPLVSNPTQFAPLAIKDTFLLSAPASEAYWVLSWKQIAPVMSFIGAPSQNSSRGTN